MTRRVPAPLVLAGLGIGLVAAIVLALGSGAVSIPPGEVVRILLDHARLGDGAGIDPTRDAVLWSIRLPRVLLGVTVGAGLAVAGAALQGIFRNPLADPQLVGISSGAAAGSALGVLLLESSIGSMSGPLGAFAGALAAGLAVYAFARDRGRTEVVTLVLAGIAVAAIGGALAGFLSVVADDPRLGSPVFYSLGGLGVATWRLLGATAPLVALGVVLLPLAAREFDLVVLGEREARHLGVDVERLRRRVLLLVSITVGAAVAAAGVIGFVGLLVPHAVRLVAGPGHRVVLPASALGGAILVVVTDTAARTVALPLEVPVGLLTALIGGPVFLWLVGRTRREQGGWG